MDRPTHASRQSGAPTCAPPGALLALVAIALALPLSGPLAASDSPTARGNLILSGNADGYYNGGEWPELARTVLSILYLAIIADDADGTHHDRGHHHHGHYNQDHHCHDHYREDCPLGISVPKALLGVGLSYFVSPDLAVGGRYIYRRDFKDNDLQSLWGGGPELTYYFGQPYNAVRPFVSGSILFTRAIDRHTRERLEDGTAMNFRAGVNVALSDSWGLVLQSGYQNDQLPTGDGDPLATKTFGFGVGFTASID